LRQDGQLDSSGGPAVRRVAHQRGWPTSANVRLLLRAFVQDCSDRRSLLKIASGHQRQGPSTSRTRDRLVVEEAAASDIRAHRYRQTLTSRAPKKIIPKTIERDREALQHQGSLYRVPPGSGSSMTSPQVFKDSELIIIGAPPSVGKDRARP
jgi:replicative DNA helicase